ncbi:MAG TPA: tetratricopeptide repeat protein, partial [Cyclobacteriaceae bacterium]|nr:tetratricopeptide repeat protein [Cyclobacteriaceae bacterium]
MKKGLYIFFCFLTATVSFGQKSLDSLENKLANASDDSVRFQILMKLSEESEFYDYSKCRKYAEEASVVAERINSYRLKGYLYFRLAFLENVEGDYSDALRYHQQLINLYVANKDSSANLCRALMNVGRDYLDLGEYEDGYYYLTQSFKVAKSHNKVPQPADSLVMAIALHNIGDVFLQLGRFDIALKHIEASQVISENIHDTEAPAYNYSVLGELFRRKKDYDQSEEYLLSSLAEARKHKIRVLIP